MQTQSLVAALQEARTSSSALAPGVRPSFAPTSGGNTDSGVGVNVFGRSSTISTSAASRYCEMRKPMEEAMTDNENNSGSTDEISAIEYYWRPGCPFCMMLTPKLEATNIPLDEHNIWDSPDAAAKVRSVADGNETVPTVVIGSVSLVNPSIEEVEAAVAEHAPHLVA